MIRSLYLLAVLSITLQSWAQQYTFTSYSTKEGLSNNYVEHIVQDKSGYLWIATRMGLNRFNGSEFKHYYADPTDPASLPFNNILSLYVAADNILWLGGYGSSIASLDSKTQTFTTYQFEKGTHAHDLDVAEIFADTDGEIAVTTSKGVFRLQDGLFRHDKQSTQAPIKRNESVLYKGQQWIATQNGIVLIEKNGNKRVFSAETTPQIKSNSVKLVFRDRDDNVWFGTHGGGLVMHPLRPEEMQFYSNHNSAIKNNITTSFFSAADSTLWIATDGGGISVLDTDKKAAKQIKESPSLHSVLDLAYDQARTLWCASWNTGIFAADIDTYTTLNYDKKFADAGLSMHIKAVAVRGDTVYCGTYGDGLILINKKDGSIKSHRNNQGLSVPGNPMYINDILVDKDGAVWVASTRGLFVYRDGTMKRYEIQCNEPHQMAQRQMVWAVREGSDGRILVATAYNAYIIDKKTNRFTEIELDIAPPYDVKMIVEDTRHRIWIGVHDYLFVIAPDGATAEIKMTQSDFPLDYFNAGAIYQAANDQIFIGTQEGFYSFNPDSLDINEKAPAIVLETFSVNYAEQIPGRSAILTKHINETDMVELKYNDFPLSLSFASINFNHQSAIVYAYMIEGIDTRWTTINGKNELQIRHLQPGNYQLKIRNSNKYGVWSASAKTILLHVSPPVWQTWWFRALVAAAALLCIVVLYRVRVAQLRHQKVYLTKEVARQTQTLREQNEAIEEQKKKLELQADALQEKLLELHDQKEDLVALNAEITEQSAEMVTTNKQLSSAIDTKNKLLSIIAHDLKNPFNVILIAAQKLAQSDKAEMSKANSEYAQFIHTASKNVFAILSNLLDWALSQSGYVSFTPVDISLHAFLHEQAESNKVFASQNDIKIAVSCSQSACCFADEQMLRIVIRNLIQNSLKFTPDGGMISINCTEDAECIYIEIIDTGIGMDEATMNSLFDIRSIISEKGTRDEEGRGLGLLVARDFIERNKGSIQVSSKKNKGSNFKIKLPKGTLHTHAQPLPGATADIGNIAEIEPIKRSEITILLVDDNDRLREQLGRSLSEHYTVVACSNAREAADKCTSMKIDLLVSDIVMNDMDGVSLCRMVKEELKLKMPIVLITGIDDSEMQVRAYNAGADAFIKKPFDLNVLLARIQNLLKPQQAANSMNFSLGTNAPKPMDEAFRDKLKEAVEKGIPQPDFSVELLSDILGMSRASLFRKTRRVLGISPSEYIQHARMQVAARLLQDRQIRVSEVAYMVGFSDPHYFTNCFTKHYGISPSEYKEKQ